MKSLEHLIREIQEGKTEKSEKKTLESSIRNVMSKESSYAAKDSKPVDEHCGCDGEKKKKVSKEDSDKLPGSEDKMDEAIGTLGTDKYQGTEFKSIRTATPHIQPPKGDETHSQAPENASRLRSIAKEKGGINRVSEGLAAKALPYLDDLARFVTKAPKSGAAPKIKPVAPEPVAPKPNIPDSTPPTKVPPSEVPKPANDPAPAPKPSEKPAVTPGQPSVKPSTKPQVAPAPAVEPAPATKPQVAPAPAVEPAPATKPQAAVEPATNPKAANAPKASPETAPKQAPKRGPRMPDIRLPGMPSFSNDGTPKHAIAPKAPWKVHGTKAHRVHESSGTDVRKKIYDMPIGGERKETSYVGRPNDDVKGASEKLSRQAQYKIKIIDESKKLAGIVKEAVKEKKEILDKPTKVFDYGKGDLVVINPDPKKNTLDVKDQ